MRHGPVAGALLLGVLMLVAAPGAAIGAEPAAGTGTLDELRGALESEERDLADVRDQIRRTDDAVQALDADLQLRSAELDTLRADLLAAERHREEAVAVEAQARQRLRDAQADLAARSATWAQDRAQLADRAVHAYKHGGGVGNEVLVRGLIGADDWHEVAVNVATATRLLDDDATAVRAAAAGTRAAAHGHARVAALRAEARAAAQQAIQGATAAQRLVDRHHTLIEVIDAQQTERARLLDELRSDATTRAVLVQELTRQVARLELAAGWVLVDRRELDAAGPPPSWADRLPAAGRPWAAAVEAAAARQGIDGRLLAALVWTESAFRPDAVSSAGALGLAQLMPGTARGLGVDPRDPLANLRGGARYLRQQLDRFGRVDLALAAYNAGPGRVAPAHAVPDILETQLYVVRVLDRYERLLG